MVTVGLVAAAPAMAAPNGWTAAVSLATARVQAVTVVLQSGEVLVAGGEDANGGTSLASSEIYNPATGMWSDGPDMTRARTGAAAVLLRNGDVLVAGGLTNGLASSTPQTAELYDPFTNTFAPTGMLNDGRENAGIAPLPNGGALVVGGADGSTVLSSAETYDPGTGTFTAVSPMSAARDTPMVTALPNGDVLAAGGGDHTIGAAALASAEVYDPRTHQWMLTANAMSVPRDAGGIAPLPGGRVLLAGGVDASFTTLDTTDIYDLATNSFTAAAPMTQGRAVFGITPLANGDVIVAGGAKADPSAARPLIALDSTEIYDPVRNAWSPGGSMPTAVIQPGMVTLGNGQVLEAAGTPDLAASTAQAAVFDPAFAPSAPSAAAAIPGDGSALVTFTAAAANGAPVTGYTVTASSGQVMTLMGGVTHTTVTNLTNGAPVTFTVTATNAEGTSPASAPSNAVTPTAATTASTGSRVAPDKAATLRLSGLASRMTLKQFLKGLRFKVTPSKAAALQITLTGTTSRAVIGRFNLALATKRFGLSAAKRSVKLVPSRKLVGHPRAAKVQLTVVAVDAAGTRSQATRTLTIKS
jgi:hypothetical protein